MYICGFTFFTISFSVENTYNIADNDEGPSSDDLYYEEEEYDKGESPSLEIENDYQGGDGLLTFFISFG